MPKAKTQVDVSKLENINTARAVIEAVRNALSSLEASHDAVIGVNPAPDQKWLMKHAHRVAEGSKVLIEHHAVGLFEPGQMNTVNFALMESDGPLALAVGKPHSQATGDLGVSERELKLLGFTYTAPRNGVGGHDREFTQTWGEQLLAALWAYAAQQAQAALAAAE
jgi:hypothetical protein